MHSSEQCCGAVAQEPKLKWPKSEMFFAGIFTEIRPVWVGDSETRQKI
jgi:hypothetical protein